MKTLIAIPTTGTVPVRFMSAVLAMQRTGKSDVMVTDNSLVYDARNQIARAAVRDGYDRVLWLDSDMVFEPDVMERLSARIDEGRQFVTGLYFQRRPPCRPTIFRRLTTDESGGQTVTRAEAFETIPEGIFQVEASGFGLVMTTGRLLKEVTERYGLPFTPVPGFGEDLAFCLRAREAGYPLWCDSGIRAGHLGVKIYGEEDWEKVQSSEFKVQSDEAEKNG